MNQSQAAVAIAMAGLRANSEMLSLLARRGLISPDDVETISESVMSGLRQPADHPDHQMLEEMAAYVESSISGPLGSAMQEARAHWKEG